MSAVRKLFFVILLSFFPPFGSEYVVDIGFLPDFGPLILRFKNHMFLYDYFKEDTINVAKYWEDYNSGMKKVVLVKLEKQHMDVLDFSDTFRIAINTKVSTGKREGWTPRGEFKILKKRNSRVSKTYGGKMFRWNCITEDEAIGIHGLENNTSFENYLGRPVSHGCIRISNRIAKVFYDTVPIGTLVSIE